MSGSRHATVLPGYRSAWQGQKELGRRSAAEPAGAQRTCEPSRSLRATWRPAARRAAAGVALSRLSLGVAPGARLSKFPNQRPRAPAVRIPFPAMLESRPTSDRAQISAGDSIASTFRLLWHGARPLEVPAHIGLVPLPVSAGATRTVVSVALA